MRSMGAAQLRGNSTEHHIVGNETGVSTRIPTKREEARPHTQRLLRTQQRQSMAMQQNRSSLTAIVGYTDDSSIHSNTDSSIQMGSTVFSTEIAVGQDVVVLREPSESFLSAGLDLANLFHVRSHRQQQRLLPLPLLPIQRTAYLDTQWRFPSYNANLLRLSHRCSSCRSNTSESRMGMSCDCSQTI